MARNRVVMLPSPARATSASWSPLQRKRKTLWHHGERNRLVARVANACLEQNRQVLGQMGIPARKKNLGASTHRVVVLVEGTEHGLALAPMLPGWEVLDALPTQDSAEEEEGEPGSPLILGSIVTWMYAQRRGVRAHYLVRATGWRGRLGLGAGEINWFEPPTARLVVVDFDDVSDFQARTDTEARVREYREQYLEVTWDKKTTARAT